LDTNAPILILATAIQRLFSIIGKQIDCFILKKKCANKKRSKNIGVPPVFCLVRMVNVLLCHLNFKAQVFAG